MRRIFNCFRKSSKRPEPCPQSPYSFPIFIFAASWRTGSTLLQRIINASGQVFIWGEPAFLAEVNTLFSKLEKHLSKAGSDPERAFVKEVGSWIPVVSPGPERAVQALRAFFNELYAGETVLSGIDRWGFKEVRPHALTYMKMLRAVYPEARFIFLVRDPYDTFRSVRGKKFYARFKDPLQPVKVWHQNVYDFFNSKIPAQKCLLVKYEDLAGQSRDQSQLIEKICSHVGVDMTDKMFEELGVRTDPSGCNVSLSHDEISAVSGIVYATAPLLGYSLLQED